jgi:hypothetical protein
MANFSAKRYSMKISKKVGDTIKKQLAIKQKKKREKKKKKPPLSLLFLFVCNV